MPKSDDKSKEGASSAGGTAPTESPPAKGGGKSSAKASIKAEPMVDVIFLKQHTFAGPQFPGGCKTFYPKREQTFRAGPGQPPKTRTLPADRHRFSKRDFEHLATQGIVARIGGDA